MTHEASHSSTHNPEHSNQWQPLPRYVRDWVNVAHARYPDLTPEERPAELAILDRRLKNDGLIGATLRVRSGTTFIQLVELKNIQEGTQHEGNSSIAFAPSTEAEGRLMGVVSGSSDSQDSTLMYMLDATGNAAPYDAAYVPVDECEVEIRYDSELQEIETIFDELYRMTDSAYHIEIDLLTRAFYRQSDGREDAVKMHSNTLKRAYDNHFTRGLYKGYLAIIEARVADKQFVQDLMHPEFDVSDISTSEEVSESIEMMLLFKNEEVVQRYTEIENDINLNEYDDIELSKIRKQYHAELKLCMNTIDREEKLTISARSAITLGEEQTSFSDQTAWYSDPVIMKVDGKWRVTHGFILESPDEFSPVYILPEDLSKVVRFSES